MNSSLLLTYLIGHFLGDYYFQSDEIASNKNYSIKVLNKHGLIYFITMILVIVPIYSFKSYNLNIVIAAFFISLIHYLLDLIKKNKHRNEIKSTEKIKDYLTDQILHIFTIVILSFLVEETDLFGNLNGPIIRLSGNNFTILPIAEFIQYISNINYSYFLSWILAILIIIKPIQITIKIVLNKYKPEEKKEDNSLSNAGALIGILERCIIFLLLASNQYAAIGFVLTAKSVARYNKMASEHKFAEYFLLGTLLSTLLVILTYIIVL